jgi:hypothetical protein
MPNGNPNFSAAKLQEWFAPLSPELMNFASAHNLLIDKYYHESPSWSFRFNHPKGGQASISLSMHGDDTAGVGSSWHVDDYDRFTRSIHWRKERRVQKVASEIRSALESELAAVLAVPLGEWNQVADGYRPIWSRYTKAEFEAMTPKYPVPIP